MTTQQFTVQELLQARKDCKAAFKAGKILDSNGLPDKKEYDKTRININTQLKAIQDKTSVTRDQLAYLIHSKLELSDSDISKHLSIPIAKLGNILEAEEDKALFEEFKKSRGK